MPSSHHITVGRRACVCVRMRAYQIKMKMMIPGLIHFHIHHQYLLMGCPIIFSTSATYLSAPYTQHTAMHSQSLWQSVIISDVLCCRTVGCQHIHEVANLATTSRAKRP